MVDGDYYWIMNPEGKSQMIGRYFENRPGHGRPVWYTTNDGWFNHGNDVKIIRRIPRPRVRKGKK